MNYGELMAGLRQGKIGHLYLLAGEEAYYIDKAREALLKTWQCPLEDVQRVPVSAYGAAGLRPTIDYLTRYFPAVMVSSASDL